MTSGCSGTRWGHCMALQKASSVGASYRPLGGRTTRGGRAVSLRQWQDRLCCCCWCRGAAQRARGGSTRGCRYFLGQLCFSKVDVNLGNINLVNNSENKMCDLGDFLWCTSRFYIISIHLMIRLIWILKKTIFTPRVCLFLGFKVNLNWDDCSPDENCNLSCWT